jgi:serine/threonine-protein kinase
MENNLRLFRPIGTVLALSLMVATTHVIPDANAREADIPFRSIVPNSWTLLPPEPQSYGRRFVSPAGDAWLWYFAVSANREGAVNASGPVSHPPTERVTYERQGADWLVSSGYRGDRIFYRKAILACKGTKCATLRLNILHRKSVSSITLSPVHLLHFERTRTLAAGTKAVRN